jgi:hypothetical protein
MTSNYDADSVAQGLRSVSPDVGTSGTFQMREDGIQPFMIMTARLLTTDEMISLCRELAVAIRREIPERPDGWAARILAGNRSATIMGDYFIGWAGHADEWHLREGMDRKATDHTDWQAFRDRLQEAVAAVGVEGERAGHGGDFKVYDDDSDPLEQTLFVNNPEFLTRELIVIIQSVIRERSADGVVTIFPAFGKPLETLYKGLEVRADSVVEKWDRQEAEKLLGDRLKI